MFVDTNNTIISSFSLRTIIRNSLQLFLYIPPTSLIAVSDATNEDCMSGKTETNSQLPNCQLRDEQMLSTAEAQKHLVSSVDLLPV